MLARQVLMIPSLAIAGVYAAVLLLPRIGVPVPAMTLQLFSVAWAFALCIVAQSALKEQGKLGKVVFSITILLVILEILVQQQIAQAEANELIYTLISASVAFSFVSVGFAVSALHRAENKNDWPFTYSAIFTYIAIFFLPFGIWFLRHRIKPLLMRSVP